MICVILITNIYLFIPLGNDSEEIYPLQSRTQIGRKNYVTNG